MGRATDHADSSSTLACDGALPMNFLILGDGPDELAWAKALSRHAEHTLWAVYPGFKAFPHLLGEGRRAPASDSTDDDAAFYPHVPARDFDDALATQGVEAAIVGGAAEFRSEALRRVAAEGLPLICIHPPGTDSEAYYQVALSRAETGAVIVPDLPMRIHPGVAAIQRAISDESFGAFRSVTCELSSRDDLARYAFPRAVDVVRLLLGEVEAVTATGDPPGVNPTEHLVVQLRGPGGRRAEVRIESGPDASARLTFTGSNGSLALEYDSSFDAPARLVERTARGESVTELEPWDPHDAILDVLTASIAGKNVHPGLLDGTRATELGEATVRSLRRARTVDLHYEEISEDGTFKSVMTSLGCVILLGIILVLPAALVGPVIGIPQTIYIAYAFPILLVLFIVLQFLRLGIRRPREAPPSAGHTPTGEPDAQG